MKSCAKESGIDVTTCYDVLQNREWVVFERIRDTEQRIPCSSRLQPSTKLGSKFGWPSSFASYAKICHICPLEFVIVFHLKKLRPRGALWSFELSSVNYPRGYRREFSKR